MTATAPVGTTTATHPLEMPTEAELHAVREVLVEAGLLTASVRYCFADLEEPEKAAVLAHRDGDTVERRFRAVLLDLDSGRSWDTVVSASTARSCRPASSTRPATASRRSSTPSSSRWRTSSTPTPAGPTRSPLAGSTRPTSARCRSRPGSTTTPTRSGAGWPARSGSARTAPRTTRGRTRSTASSPTWT